MNLAEQTDDEPTFRLRNTDAAGRTAADVCTTATFGTGTRGTFDVTIPHRATRSGAGLLAAYWNSIEVGHPVVAGIVPSPSHAEDGAGRLVPDWTTYQGRSAHATVRARGRG
ncbi:Gmad2 immunoglobulin-like domain-containing protein [Streptomyces umbrinus]|uniref:Gmad2 immunoglobulin-like domain-containing protein n=1 Tax=Streptomyces umbrinus TaxID=67370 RepID=UPI0034054878